MLFIALALVLLLGTTAFAEESENGSLVIVGGALRADNDAVYERFIELAGGANEAKVAIVPAASGSPHKYAKMFE
jgi:cyanophycinase-like exopeptidase